jgi:oxygen-dependent protoporphyrinogen oxidase
MKKIIIIGGGIAGLAAAYRVQEEIQNTRAPIHCTLLEASGHLGGKINTERFDGFIIERGPDSFISQKPSAIQLCRKLGLGDSLVGTNPHLTKTFVYTGGKMLPMPEGLSLMVPTRFMPFVFSPLFSWPGKLRMGLDLLLPGKNHNGDESLADFVRRRLGEEALKKMAEPMLAGIYASDPERMSIQATFPMFAQTEKKYRSLILGMLAQKRNTLTQPKKPAGSPLTLFMTLKNGLGELAETLVARSPNIAFRTNQRIVRLDPAGNGTWRATLADGETLEANAVVLATPANISADLLDTVAGEAARRLRQIHYVSTVAVTLAYRKEGFSHPLDGFGFVVPRAENCNVMACTWTSTKFPHRAPQDHVLIRCYLGGALREDLAEQDAPMLERLVRQDLARMMGIGQTPEFCKVFYNKKSNVQYHVGHEQLVDSILGELANHPGLYVAGSAYRGIGIPDCITNGASVAESVLHYIACH